MRQGFRAKQVRTAVRRAPVSKMYRLPPDWPERWPQPRPLGPERHFNWPVTASCSGRPQVAMTAAVGSRKQSSDAAKRRESCSARTLLQPNAAVGKPMCIGPGRRCIDRRLQPGRVLLAAIGPLLRKLQPFMMVVQPARFRSVYLQQM